MVTWERFQQVICPSGANCNDCRTKPAWRASFHFPEVDFACPQGHPLGAAPAPPPPIPWPLPLQPLKLLAIPSDTGLGDIVERIVGPIGGDAFKAWHLRIFGKPCGCQQRKEAWNQMYPL